MARELFKWFKKLLFRCNINFLSFLKRKVGFNFIIIKKIFFNIIFIISLFQPNLT